MNIKLIKIGGGWFICFFYELFMVYLFIILIWYIILIYYKLKNIKFVI